MNLINYSVIWILNTFETDEFLFSLSIIFMYNKKQLT